MRNTVFLIASGLLATAAAAADVVGYLVDSQGQPVRSGTGSCFRSGSWSAQLPGVGCDATPDRIVLLPDADGKVGAVVVRSAAGERTLNQAYAGVEASSQALVGREESAASVQQRYGTTLAAQPPRPLSFTVHFVTGSASELTPESQPVIAAMKDALRQRPAPEITVIGHTDRVGALETNDRLSRGRAETVRAVLVASGVTAASLDVAGRGEREPLVETADEVAEARNRRVEITIR